MHEDPIALWQNGRYWAYSMRGHTLIRIYANIEWITLYMGRANRLCISLVHIELNDKYDPSLIARSFAPKRTYTSRDSY
jgi:hypothetical protein